MYKSSEYPFLYHFSLFDSFSARLSAGVTGRQGGISDAPYDSFNTALHCGDETEAVIGNRKRLCEALHIDFSAYTCSEQIHGSESAAVAESQKGAGCRDYGSTIKGTDALMTDRKGILLNIHLADCVPLIFYDWKKHTGALVHAGWKGTAAGIAEKTVRAMNEAFGSSPESILAAIGPSIGPCCFEIGSDTADKIESGFNYSTDVISREENGIHADLWKANEEQLLEAGLKQHNIESAGICTSCHNDEFYSYRAEGGQTGRFSAYLLLK